MGGGYSALSHLLGENDIELLDGKIDIRRPQRSAQYLLYRSDHVDRRERDGVDQVVLPRKPVTGTALYLAYQPAQGRSVTNGNPACILRMALHGKSGQGNDEQNRKALQKSNSQAFFHN